MTFSNRMLPLIALLALAASLSACGRRGALVTPDQAAAASQTQTAAPEDLPAKERKFLLDKLIGG